MRNLVVQNQVTLDGVFDNEEEWQRQFWEDSDEKERYTEAQITAFDALLLGRLTYQKLAAYWPSKTDDVGFADWINSIPKHVVSTTLDEGDLEWNARLITENVADEVATLKQQDGQDILLFGSGDLLHTLMQHDLVDEYRIWVHPVVHGSGTQLFTDESEPTGLKLVEVETTGSGVVVLTYRPAETDAEVDE